MIRSEGEYKSFCAAFTGPKVAPFLLYEDIHMSTTGEDINRSLKRNPVYIMKEKKGGTKA